MKKKLIITLAIIVIILIIVMCIVINNKKSNENNEKTTNTVIYYKDYLTLQKYDTNYIQEGDILICSGDLSKKGYSMGDNDFDTKDNAIIVLKSNDYNQMKKDALIGKRTYSSIVTVGDEYVESGYVYLKYSLEDDTHSDTGYNFPFAVKEYIEDDTKVIGDLKKGKRVKVTYKDENVDFDNMKLQSIEVIEN